jgi:hypothetical protein
MVVIEQRKGLSERRIGIRWIEVEIALLREFGAIIVATQLCTVVALDGFGELMQKRHQLGHRLIGEPGGQTHERQIVGRQHEPL